MSTAPNEVDEIRRQMADIRRELHEDVRGVVATAEAATDWRRYLTAYPWVSLGAAFAVGYLVVPRKHRPTAIIADLSKVQAAVNVAQDRKEATTRKKGLIGAALGMAVPFVLRAAQGYALKYLEQWMLQQQVNAMHGGPAPASSGAQARPGSRSNRPSGPRPGPGMD